MEPQSHRAHKGRTNGDDYYPGCNWLGFRDAGKRYRETSRLCELCASAVNISEMKN